MNGGRDRRSCSASSDPTGDRSRVPILVTGSHRSGTTWVGRMLAAAPNVAHVHEPFNPANRLSWLGAPPVHPFVHVDAHDPHGYGPAVDRIIALRPPVIEQLRSVRTPRHLAANVREAAHAAWWRAHRARVLVKDPLAVMSAEWFATRYDADVVLLVRHPAAFAGSLKRLDWTFDFRDFTRQPTLMDDALRPFADEIEAAAAVVPDIIDQAVLLWRCINHVVTSDAKRHPDWMLERYEDLARDPAGGARRLYEGVGLDWDESVAQRIERLSSSENPTEVAKHRTRDVRRDSASAMWTWLDRLDADEIARIRRGTADVAEGLYGAEDWEPPATASNRSSTCR